MNWTQQKQQQFAIELNNELDKVTMSWSKELREWYEYAIKALDHANLVRLRIPAEFYAKLFTQEVHGVNMNVITVLANNLEYTSPSQLGIDALQMATVLKLNGVIGAYWENLAGPIKQTIEKRMEIMDGKVPTLVVAN
jgi:hypothetical protein